MGNAATLARAAGPFTELWAGWSSDTTADQPAQQELSQTTCLQGAADTNANSAKAAVPPEGLRARQKCRQTMQEYTNAR
jgi:hypothetical protein